MIWLADGVKKLPDCLKSLDLDLGENYLGRNTAIMELLGGVLKEMPRNI